MDISGAGNGTNVENKKGLWSVEQRVDLGPLDRVKSIVANNPSIQIIDKAKCDSLNTMVGKLNSSVAATEGGMCIVYSKVAKQHFLLYQAGEEQRAMDISGTGSDEKENKAQWSVEQRTALGPLDSVKIFVANNPDIPIIDKTKCTSLNAMVSKLNSSAVAPACGKCIVYSKAAQQHFLLYQTGKE